MIAKNNFAVSRELAKEPAFRMEEIQQGCSVLPMSGL